MMKKNILVADDDASIRFVISKSLSRAGYNVRATDNAHTLMKWVASGEGDVVLTDVHMEQEDIFNFVPDLKKARPELPIIIMSANTSVMTALKSGQFGVFEYIPKPFDLSEIQMTIERALGSAQDETRRSSGKTVNEIGPMIGKSVSMQPVFRGISDFMSGDVPIIVFGGVGTGKNLTASLIHSAGNRKGRVFLSFDDYSDHGEFVEKLADGDLLIDRLDELSDDGQRKLLRILEDNENRPAPKRFRSISTSNLPAHELQVSKALRPELLSHLRGGQINLPLLSERTEDIEDLALFFLNQDEYLDRKRKFSKPAIKALREHIWSGNVRELRNLTRTIPLQYADAVISEEIVKSALAAQSATRAGARSGDGEVENIRIAGRQLLLDELDGDIDGVSTPYAQAMAWVEKPLIEEALKLTKGNNVKASELLGIHRNTLRTKIKSLGITVFQGS